MADNQQKSGDPEQDDIAKLGGQTSMQMGTEYEMVSSPARDAAEAIGEATPGTSAGGQHDADSGREPEEYINKQTGKDSTDGDNVNKPGDIQGEIGRQRVQQPGAGEGHNEKGT